MPVQSPFSNQEGSMKLFSFGALAAIAAAIVFALPAGAASPATSPIVNGSFETGDLTGWTATLGVGGSASVVMPGVVVIGTGVFAAQLVATASISQVVPKLGGGGTVNKLRGYASFVDAEGGSCTFNDIGRVLVQRIVAGSVASTATVFNASSCATGSTGWVQWSYTIPGQGAYRITATAANGGDDIISSELFVDHHTYQGLSQVGP
jgi:hypothetical protein